MQQPLLKSLLLGSYVASLALLWSLHEKLDAFVLLLAVFVLAYCSIIVLSQLASILGAICHWRVAESRECREENQETPAVVFETESEAT